MWEVEKPRTRLNEKRPMLEEHTSENTINESLGYMTTQPQAQVN